MLQSIQDRGRDRYCAVSVPPSQVNPAIGVGGDWELSRSAATKVRAEFPLLVARKTIWMIVEVDPTLIPEAQPAQPMPTSTCPGVTTET